LKEGNSALIVDGNPHDWFYSALAGAVENGNFERLQPFISPAAKVHKTAVIGENVHVEAGAVIGAGAVILPNTYIGANTVIKPNATIGGDGFENAIIQGRRSIVPHAGGVWLAEGVQVGSSTCVDRGLFGDFTFAGAYTTIDNLVHFAHSARTGQSCSLVACSEISGSVVLGDGVWLGPNVSVNQSLRIGDYCYVGTGAVVTRNLPAHSLAYGSPAKVAAQVCACRAKLQFEAGRATCAACGKRYQLDSAGTVQSV
jgi:UDP-3-O-[3-hydroxymyristoyl] glucosamine N-acyltransferase